MLTFAGTVGGDRISATRSKGRYTPSGFVSQTVKVTALNSVNLSHVRSAFPLKSMPTRSYIKYLRTQAPKGFFIACFHSPLYIYRFKAFLTVTTERGSKALRYVFQGCNNQVPQTQALPVQKITSRIRIAWEMSSSARAGIVVN